MIGSKPRSNAGRAVWKLKILMKKIAVIKASLESY